MLHKAILLVLVEIPLSIYFNTAYPKLTYTPSLHVYTYYTGVYSLVVLVFLLKTSLLHIKAFGEIHNTNYSLNHPHMYSLSCKAYVAHTHLLKRAMRTYLFNNLIAIAFTSA